MVVQHLITAATVQGVKNAMPLMSQTICLEAFHRTDGVTNVKCQEALSEP